MKKATQVLYVCNGSKMAVSDLSFMLLVQHVLFLQCQVKLSAVNLIGNDKETTLLTT